VLPQGCDLLQATHTPHAVPCVICWSAVAFLHGTPLPSLMMARLPADVLLCCCIIMKLLCDCINNNCAIPASCRGGHCHRSHTVCACPAGRAAGPGPLVQGPILGAQHQTACWLFLKCWAAPWVFGGWSHLRSCCCVQGPAAPSRLCSCCCCWSCLQREVMI
jgi:hypothetical protein